MSKRLQLIMPDSPLRKTYTSFLSEMGFTIKLMDDIKGAVDAADSFGPDIVLCYKHLASGTVFDLAQSICNASKTDRRPPILMLTPDEKNEYNFDQDFSDQNIDEVVFLPVEQAELYGTVTKWLDGLRPIITPPEPTEETEEAEVPMVAQEAKSYKGIVNLKNITRLFYSIFCERASGTLLLKADRRRMKVLIDGASVVDVTTNFILEDSLGRYLVRTHKITEKQNEQSLEYAEHRRCQQGEALIRLGILEAPRVFSYITEHKMMKLMRLYQRSWNKAKFVFNNGPLEPEIREFGPTPINKLLRLGVFTIATRREVKDFFVTTNKMDSVLVLTRTFEQVAEDLGLDEKEVELIDAIKGRTIRQLETESPTGFEECMRWAFLMIACKGMRMVEDVD